VEIIKSRQIVYLEVMLIVPYSSK